MVSNGGTVAVNQSLVLKARAIAGGQASAATSATYHLFLDPRTLWVDANAAAVGTGSFLAPYKTIGAAVAASKPSAIILVRAGTYRELVRIEKSGTPDAPYTLQGAPGERVVVSGMGEITGWKPFKDNIYVANVGTWKLDSFYVGMEQKHIAQSPNIGVTYWQWQSRGLSGSNTVVTDTAHLVGVGDLSGGYIQSLQTADNSITGRTIISNDPVAGTLTYGNTFKGPDVSPYIIKNLPQLIDQPGEWATVASGNNYSVYFWPKNPEELSLTQSRKSDRRAVFLNGVHDVLVQGLEVIGSTSDGIQVVHSTNVDIRWNTIHDNGGYIWNPDKTISQNIAGSGVALIESTNVNVSNNYITLNNNGVLVSSSTNCTITKNEIAYNTTDGIDVSGRNNTRPTLNLTLSNNHIHHHHNLTQHADAFQTYDIGVQNMHILDNLVMGSLQIMHNGFSGDYHGNVIWGPNINSLGRIPGVGNIVLENNTIKGPLTCTGQMPTFLHENLIAGRLTVTTANYTGDRNLIFPIPPDRYVFVGLPNWSAFKTVAEFYANCGQEQHSLVAEPVIVNMPTTLRILNDITLCTPNTLSIRDGAGAPPLGDFEVGGHIEINMDGVVRTITAMDTEKKTITFDMPLAGVPQLKRDTFVENWGSRTNFARDSRLAPGSPGSALSATGGPVGSLIDIASYQAGDFDGDSIRDIPVLPADIPHSRDFHITNWLPFGN